MPPNPVFTPTSGVAGATAVAEAKAGTTSATNTASAAAYATGGRGGRGAGSGAVGGKGGIARLDGVFATGFNASATAAQYGGDGGQGFNGAVGGAGAASSVSNEVGGNAKGGTLTLRQTAKGGAGGSSSKIFSDDASDGGAGGNATSTLIFNDPATNTTTAAVFKAFNDATGGAGGSGAKAGKSGAATGTLTAIGAGTVDASGRATGGAGGNINAGLTGSGGDGGTATSTVLAETTSATKQGKAVARLYGGDGGQGRGAGNAGGAGGSVSKATARGVGYSAYAYTRVKGGLGGTGLYGAAGGAGGSATLKNAVTGATSGGDLTLRQRAIGGAGGYALEGTGGKGGAALSQLTFNDETANAVDARKVFARSYAYGGNSGYANNALAGGTATATVAITAVNAIEAVARGRGGQGGTARVKAGGSGASGGDGGAMTGVTASAISTGGKAVYASATAFGGGGGLGVGGGRTGGAGGAASGSSAYARGGTGDVRAYVAQSGGPGGSGSDGARAGDGADSVLINAVRGVADGGKLRLNPGAYGGTGGDSTQATGGSGGNATSTLSFDETLNTVHAAEVIARAGAGGGTGRRGGIKGGEAGDATASLSLKATNGASARAEATGGGGGYSTTGAADGAEGGSATVTSVSSTSLNGIAKAYGDATGSGGGYGRSGKLGGAGGVASLGAVNASGVSALAVGFQYGGNGGDGRSNSDGRAGTASALSNIVSGASKGGYVKLRQTAGGGRGGDSEGGKGGAGAAGTSDLTFNDTTANAIAASFLYGLSRGDGGRGGIGATGGAGAAGSATIALTGSNQVQAVAKGYGGDGGGISSGSIGDGAAAAAGTASAVAITSSLTQFATAQATSRGGRGYTGRGAGKTGGAGGVAGATTATATGGGASAYAIQYGGSGGGGYDGANGGAGASVSQSNVVSGRTAGGTMLLRQRAEAGNGGAGASGGAGGSAVSSLTFNDQTANPVGTSKLTGRVEARGGNGGNAGAGGSAGAGAAATATSDMTAERAVEAFAIATGGVAGTVNGAKALPGGAATATATAHSTGTGTATAIAEATGGTGLTDGAATTNATAIAGLGQKAAATAKSVGGSGDATAIATTSTAFIIKSVTGTANAEVGSTASARSEANTLTPQATFLTAGHQSHALATAAPNATFITNALGANAAVGAVLGAKPATVLASGTQGGAYAADATGSRTYDSTIVWTIDTLTLSGDLILGLLDTESKGLGFDTLDFDVFVGGVQKVDQSFTTLAQAQGFFDNNALNLGDAPNAPDLTVTVTFSLTTDDLGAGFGMNYVLGTTNTEPDTVAPLKPGAPDLTAASDTGQSNTDNITFETLPTFTGQSEAFATIKLFSGTTQVGTGTADAAGNWSITTTTKLSDGSQAITVTATDAAGNTSVKSDALTVVVDTVPFPAPSAPDLLAEFDSGASNTDNITKFTNFTVTGTATPNAQVLLSNGTLGVADAAGIWTIKTQLSASVFTQKLSARTRDAAGNLSGLSTALSIKIDTTAPAAPSVPDLAASSDLGTSSTDNVTAATTPTFTGTTEANATVALFAGATQVGSGVASAAGAWSITASKLADGVHDITAQATDVAGNTGVKSGALKVTIDTSAPTTVPGAPDLIDASDSGSSSTDNRTNDTTPTFTGSAEAGSLVGLFAGAVLVGTATADGTGIWTITSSALTDGNKSFAARNLGVGGGLGKLSSSLTVTIDTVGPISTPPNMVDSSDTGASATDNITRSTTPTFTGKTEAGASVALFDGASQIGTGKASATGDWTIKATPLDSGVHSITARATDVAGNLGAPTAALLVTVDREAPVILDSPDLVTASDTGSSATDDITSNTTPAFRGVSEAGATIALFDGATLVGSGKANGAGNWTVTVSTLTEGKHTIKAKATDLAGNVGALSPGLTVTIDTTPDAPPVFTGATTTTIVGTAAPGSTVTLTEGATTIGTAKTKPNGQWKAATALSAGSHVVTGTTTDVAGNTSAASASVTIMIGTAGNDVLFGTAGTDLLAGGAGDDTYHVNDTTDVVTEADKQGNDTIFASTDYTLAAGSSIEFLTAEAGAPGLALSGNAFANTITGGAGNDTITGGGAADELLGGGGADLFVLLALTDSTMTAGGRDRIGDFSEIDGDLIDLHLLDADTGLAGDQAFTFIDTAAFSGVAGELRYESFDADTRVLGDVNGDQAGDFSFLLSGTHTLTAARFVL